MYTTQPVLFDLMKNVNACISKPTISILHY